MYGSWTQHEGFQLFTFELPCWLWVCHKWFLLCWDMFLLFPFWWKFLSWIDSEFCQMLFLHLKMTMRFWSSLLLMYRIEWFVYIEPSLWPWNEFNLTMVDDAFLWIVRFSLLIFIENFAFYIHQRYWPVVFFFAVCLALVSGWWWLQRMPLSVPFSSVFWNSWEDEA